jgi:hypothetical protein
MNGFEDIPETRHRKEILTDRYWDVLYYPYVPYERVGLEKFSGKGNIRELKHNNRKFDKM